MPGTDGSSIWTGIWADRRGEEITRYPAVPYEEIPADTLTVTVTFTDGRVESQSIRLSLDGEGYVVAEALA